MNVTIANLIGCNGNLNIDLNKLGYEDIKESVSIVEYPAAVTSDDFTNKTAIRQNNPNVNWREWADNWFDKYSSSGIDRFLFVRDLY